MALALAAPASADIHSLPPEDENVIGDEHVVKVEPEETLVSIARRYNVGYRELQLANPKVNSWLPEVGTSVTLPARHVLPSGPRNGIVINRAELRLYYYYSSPDPDGQRSVMTFPVSMGREAWNTPLGETRVIERIRDPVWYPPQSIRDEHAADGDILPKVVPPGPDNPLGKLALRLGWRNYLIHGTNKRYGIGMRTTHGCVRMFENDIEQLFAHASIGTQVRIIDEPYKLGRAADGVIYLEAHTRTLQQEQLSETLEQLETRVASLGAELVPQVDWDAVRNTVLKPTGRPVAIGAELPAPGNLAANGSSPTAQAAAPP